jgi:hypothetical protein
LSGLGRAQLIAAVAVIVALVGLVGGAAGASAGGSAGGKVFVEPYLNQGPAQMRPHEILLSEDGTLSLYAIHYESYGGAVATATGRGYTRGCTPDCAQGKVQRPQATIRLSQVTRCEGKLIYARLQYSLKGPIPSGFKRRATFDLRPVDQHGKPLC